VCQWVLVLCGCVLCVLGYLYNHIGNGNLEIYLMKNKCVYLGIGPQDHSGTSASSSMMGDTGYHA
jgi:hypothetical protein